jgi:hypothetical protein
MLRREGLDLLGEVVGVDHHALRALRGQVAQQAGEEGLAADVDHDFGHRQPEGAQAGASPRPQ